MSEIEKLLEENAKIKKEILKIYLNSEYIYKENHNLRDIIERLEAILDAKQC